MAEQTHDERLALLEQRVLSLVGIAAALEASVERLIRHSPGRTEIVADLTELATPNPDIANDLLEVVSASIMHRANPETAQETVAAFRRCVRALLSDDPG